jgi:murein L,D-transpeptidase YcbB/YkuD
VLTNGSSLVVTFNPDRTSPVKRGLFVLENFLGTPPPPPPANVPALEASERDFKGHEPTLRESLQLHREKPLCASCHNRMDPIGLAFENFNAMGRWRDTERKQQIDGTGKLVTGETFNSVSELKHILATDHKLDFYRCLTDKLLTYAVGRGTEYYDAETKDQIVQRLQSENGRFSALLMGVIESAPFQKMRTEAISTERVASN